MKANPPPGHLAGGRSRRRMTAINGLHRLHRLVFNGLHSPQFFYFLSWYHYNTTYVPKAAASDDGEAGAVRPSGLLISA
jgi:hypothetical protein